MIETLRGLPLPRALKSKPAFQRLAFVTDRTRRRSLTASRIRGHSMRFFRIGRGNLNQPLTNTSHIPKAISRRALVRFASKSLLLYISLNKQVECCQCTFGT
jgi:hypothetical protein